jgi:hypothetical protein
MSSDSGEESRESLRAMELAFDSFRSPLGHDVRLQQWEKIPDVHTSPSYIYRPHFEALIRNAGYPLDQHSLAQAMFLQRGSYLESYALRKLRPSRVSTVLETNGREVVRAGPVPARCRPRRID